MKERVILKVLILVNFYAFVWNFLLIFSVVPLKKYDMSDYLFSLLIFFFFAVLIKHRFWLFAFIFMELNSLAHFIVAKIFATFDGNLFISLRDIDNVFAFLIIIAGAFSILASIIYFYRLLRVEDFSFKQHFRFATRKSY